MVSWWPQAVGGGFAEGPVEAAAVSAAVVASGTEGLLLEGEEGGVAMDGRGSRRAGSAVIWG